MAATRRAYTGGATSTTTTSAIASSGTTSFTITAYTGWPYGSDPFHVVVEPGTASEEKILVTRTGSTDTTINIASDSERGQDGTSAVAHSSGSTVFPVFTALDADEANELTSSWSTKGDLVSYGSSTFETLGVGSDGQVLVADSGETSGLKWSTSLSGLTVDTDTLHVDSANNRVGIGTTSPNVDLEVAGSAPLVYVTDNNNLLSDNAHSAALLFRDSANALSGGIGYLSGSNQDMDIGTWTPNGRLDFHTGSGATQMSITSSGDVGIGTTSPAYNLDVDGTGAFRDSVSLFDTTNSAGSIGTTGGAGSSNRVQITGNRGVGGVDIQTNGGLAARFNYNRMVYLPYVYSNTTGVGANMYVASDGNLFRSTSSQKYKTDIEDIGDEYADLVLQMRPVWYRSLCENDPSAWSYYGFIAEEVAELDPRLVHYAHKDGCECPEDESGMKQHEASCFVEPEGVQYDRIVPHLVNLVQRQQARIEASEARLAALEARLAALEAG